MKLVDGSDYCEQYLAAAKITQRLLLDSIRRIEAHGGRWAFVGPDCLVVDIPADRREAYRRACEEDANRLAEKFVDGLLTSPEKSE